MVMDEIKSSWADEVELDSGSLPQPTEVIEGNIKRVTGYKIENDKKVKFIRTYKIATELVPKSVASRRTLKKFGDSASDKAGPNAQTTIVSEDIIMQFISAKEEEKANEAQIESIKNVGKCRICGGEHWSAHCPYKGSAIDTGKLLENKPTTNSTMETSKSGKYVPPFMKDMQKGGASGVRGRDDTCAIRISNLSEAMTETDLEELVKKFGQHSKMYLAKDKNTGLCKGFAYVHFKTRKDAALAIEMLNGHGYDHLILTAEWSKPQNN